MEFLSRFSCLLLAMNASPSSNRREALELAALLNAVMRWRSIFYTLLLTLLSLTRQSSWRIASTMQSVSWYLANVLTWRRGSLNLKYWWSASFILLMDWRREMRGRRSNSHNWTHPSEMRTRKAILNASRIFWKDWQAPQQVLHSSLLPRRHQLICMYRQRSLFLIT